ncbi:hypothetical protein HanXRQr2_Chr17g0803521 [Helianthus annuus]|uniref:Uncharacterized protein n=1 Tax=Helianthus annuus TaxID=4232 RepID=A0A9K3GTT8_HELAN|nr:hypothetical protein HanXRQr2_Chr17g0803521 [Helianthus annuus]KAJ0813232.1 hypothetical protein HanPSC8_Chr17g0771071 [Helianthus annuus]
MNFQEPATMQPILSSHISPSPQPFTAISTTFHRHRHHNPSPPSPPPSTVTVTTTLHRHCHYGHHHHPPNQHPPIYPPAKPPQPTRCTPQSNNSHGPGPHHSTTAHPFTTNAPLPTTTHCSY